MVTILEKEGIKVVSLREICALLGYERKNVTSQLRRLRKIAIKDYDIFELSNFESGYYSDVLISYDMAIYLAITTKSEKGKEVLRMLRKR